MPRALGREDDASDRVGAKQLLEREAAEKLEAREEVTVGEAEEGLERVWALLFGCYLRAPTSERRAAACARTRARSTTKKLKNTKKKN